MQRENWDLRNRRDTREHYEVIAIQMECAVQQFTGGEWTQHGNHGFPQPLPAAAPQLTPYEFGMAAAAAAAGVPCCIVDIMSCRSKPSLRTR